MQVNLLGKKSPRQRRHQKDADGGVAGDAGGVNVFGLQAAVNIFFADGDDRLTLNGLGGDDVIDATSLEADGIKLTMNGGLGNDVLMGGDGDDLFTGGDGDDLALMGAGDDTFVWNPGDDNDTLEGQDGFDTMRFNGANVAENINIFANGGRVLFTRDVASVTMDLNDVESIDFNALGGADTVVVGDLSGTDATRIALDLGDALWAMLAFFFWFMVIWMFIGVFADIFRRNDLSGGAKAGWIFLIFVLPFLGILIYMIARPKMTEQDKQMMTEMQERQRRLEGYSSADEIAKLAKLCDEGKITVEEYEQLKAKALL